MKKNKVLIMLVLVLALVLGACSGSKELTIEDVQKNVGKYYEDAKVIQTEMNTQVGPMNIAMKMIVDKESKISKMMITGSDLETYMDMSGNPVVQYTKFGGEWSKLKVDSTGLSETKQMDQMFDFSKMLVVDEKLPKEFENAKDEYIIKVKVTKDNIGDLAKTEEEKEQVKQAMSLLAMSDIPIVIKIDKKDFHIKEITIESNMKEASFKMVMKDLIKVNEKLEIPKEALNAKEMVH